MKQSHSYNAIVILAVAMLLGSCSSTGWKDKLKEAVMLPDEKPSSAEILATSEDVTATRGTLDGLTRHNEQLRSQQRPEDPIMGRPQQAGGFVSETKFPRLAVNKGKNQKGGKGKKLPVTLDFNDVALSEILQLMFKEYLQKPYTILPEFKDKQVNFYYHAKSSQAELLQVLDALLDFHGVKLIYSNGIYGVTNKDSTLAGQPSAGGMGESIGIFKPEYISGMDFLGVARQFMQVPKGAVVLNGSDAIFVRASKAELQAIRLLAKELDTPYFDDKYLLIYRPRHLTVSSLKVLVEQYESMLGSTAKSPNKMFEVNVVKEMGLLVMVVASDAAREKLKEYLKEIDNPEHNQRQVFRYTFTNQKVTDIQGTVKSLVDQVLKREPEIGIIADRGSNSLFITATPDDFSEISRLLAKLDQRPAAVHVDVTIVEVNLTDKMRYGVQWYLDSLLENTLTDATMTLTKTALAGRGLSLGSVSKSSNRFLAFDLLKNETEFTIIANPQIIVKNNSTAKMVIGEEISIIKTTLTTDTSGQSAQNEFERRDVAITLEVKPTIGVENQIQLEIDLQDERDAGVDGNGQPKFTKRSIKTDLIVDDGETILIGGIIRTTSTRANEKLPFFGDLRFVGKLFGNSDDETKRTELIMLVTPHLLLDKEGNAKAALALMAAKRAYDKHLYEPVSKADVATKSDAGSITPIPNLRSSFVPIDPAMPSQNP